ncbi:MAG: 30S ribosomal protein S24e [Desulfurococcaceae archaeon]
MVKRIKILDKYDGEVVEERHNPLVGRIEIVFKLVHLGEGTPSRGVLKKELARLYGKPSDLVYIRKVGTEYGICETTVEAHLYESEDRAKKFEPNYLAKRDEESLNKITDQSGHQPNQ